MVYDVVVWLNCQKIYYIYSQLNIAAVSFGPVSARLGRVEMGLGSTGKLGRAWVGAWHGAWNWCMKSVSSGHHTMHQCHAPCHAPTHARPSLPVDPNPILTPPNLAVTGLHDNAAIFYHYYIFFKYFMISVNKWTSCINIAFNYTISDHVSKEWSLLYGSWCSG